MPRALLILFLFVVIFFIFVGIIAILYVELQSERRDAHRLTQAQEIVLALETYYSQNASYPDDNASGRNSNAVPISAISTAIVANGIMPEMPSDPLYPDPEGYRYCSSDSNDSFAVLVRTEDASSTYCSISRGPDAYQGTMCRDVHEVPRCNDRF